METATDIGLVIRDFAGEQDVPAMVEVINAELEADGVPRRETVEDNLAFIRHPSPGFDASRDLLIGEIGGRIVATGEKSWVDTTDGLREYRVNGTVHPDFRRRGIGTAMLAENERRARELAASHETDRERVIGSWANDRQAPRKALLERSGYAPIRWFFDMTRPLSQPILEVPLPDGLELRPVTLENVKQVFRADVEAFLDHWGGFEDTDEQLERWMSMPEFDMTLWVIAWDGDEVAGGVVNGISAVENEALGVKRGWLHSVYTRRPWRKRGLANALIARSLVLLRERGMEQGILGVDADNPTGALGLYERNGFTVAERSTAWRKPLA